MAKFRITQWVTMKREIDVEADNLKEVQEKYNNGDYDEELESEYFDGQYDSVSVKFQEVK